MESNESKKNSPLLDPTRGSKGDPPLLASARERSDTVPSAERSETPVRESWGSRNY